MTFTHGVASGDPTTDGIVLWTKVDRTDGREQALRCSVVRADESDDAPLEVLTSADVERGHTVRVEVQGLEPGTAYRYFFDADGDRSPVGSFRTLPEDPSVIRFAVVSCAKFNAGYFNVYRYLASRTDLDFVLHAGDYIYEAANTPPSSQTPGADIGRPFEPLDECRTLDDYRQRYAQYRRDPDLQALHARHAVVATLDDHELADNAWEHGAQEHRDDEHGPWSERVGTALRAWEEWIPSRRLPATRGDAIHHAFEIGSLATLVLLETRLHRSAPDAPSVERTQLGPEQEAWLRSSTGDAGSDWLVVVSPSAMAPLWSERLDDRARDALATLKIADPEVAGPFFDGWDAYADERARVLGYVGASRAAGLVLSGDVHVALASDLRLDGRTIAREWTTASVTSQNLDDKKRWVRRTHSLQVEASILGSLDHVRYCNLDDHGCMVVELSHDRARCEWWFVDTVLHQSAETHLGRCDDVDRASLG